MSEIRVPDEVIEEVAKALFEIRDDAYDDREWDEAGSAGRELYECQARTAAPIIAAWAFQQAIEAVKKAERFGAPTDVFDRSLIRWRQAAYAIEQAGGLHHE